MLQPADVPLRLVLVCMSVTLCLTCTPSTAPKADDDPPPPPQCFLSYVFIDQEGKEAFICVYDDTSVYSWNEYGATVFHPYLDGYLVGLVIDLPTLCSGDIPVCTVEPSPQCVAPPQTWEAEGNEYALCRTNDGDDLLEFFGEDARGTWYFIESWATSTVCMDE